jgi:hypothetical protein
LWYNNLKRTDIMHQNFKYNQDQERRDKLVNAKYENFDKSYAHYSDVSVDTLKILLDEKFANPADVQNSAPTIQEFYDFMVKHPEYKAHGYVIGLERSDYRVSVEGLSGVPKNIESRLDFFRKFRHADDLNEYRDGSVSCWYD